jgi:predicted RNA binding protein YcfA (HicA-like mRNA interferase family)
MDTIIGVVLGALIGFVGSYLTYRLQLRQERKKQARKVIADVAAALGQIYTNMESISWLGENYPKEAEKKIADYENRLEAQLGNLFGVLALVAADVPKAYAPLTEHAKQVQAIDEQISKALDSLGTAAGKTLFTGCQRDLERFYESWTKDIAAALKAIRLTRWRRQTKTKEDAARFGPCRVNARGGHRQFKHPTKRSRVTVSGKPSHDLSPGTLSSILKQAGLQP